MIFDVNSKGESRFCVFFVENNFTIISWKIFFSDNVSILEVDVVWGMVVRIVKRSRGSIKVWN